MAFNDCWYSRFVMYELCIYYLELVVILSIQTHKNPKPRRSECDSHKESALHSLHPEPTNLPIAAHSHGRSTPPCVYDLRPMQRCRHRIQQRRSAAGVMGATWSHHAVRNSSRRCQDTHKEIEHESNTDQGVKYESDIDRNKGLESGTARPEKG